MLIPKPELIYACGRSPVYVSIYLIAAIMLIADMQLIAAEFEVEGELTTTIYRPDKTVFKASTTGFTFGLSGHMWKAKAIYGTGYYQEFGCDGTNVYSFLVDPHPQVAKGAPTPQSLPGAITAGVYPVSVAHYVTVPWLAYASGIFCESDCERLRLPWAISEVQPEAHLCRSVVKRFDKTGTVQEVLFINDSKRAEALAGNAELIPTENTVETRTSAISRAELMHSALLGRYQVKQFTNISGTVVPTEFELEQYLPNQKSESNVLYVSYRGRVTAIRKPAWTSPFPQFPQPVYVFDRRLQDTANRMNGTGYTISNTWPTSATDPWLVNLFYKNQKQYVSTLNQSKVLQFALRGLFRVTVFAIVFGPPIWMLARWLRNRRKQT